LCSALRRHQFDLAFVRVHSVLGTGQYFSGGLGLDPELLASIDELEKVRRLIRRRPGESIDTEWHRYDQILRPTAPTIRWDREGRTRAGQVYVEGAFDSPEICRRVLPSESHTARVRFMAPGLRGIDDSRLVLSDDGQADPLEKGRACYLHLPATGDQSFYPRTLLAAPLVKHGIASLMERDPSAHLLHIRWMSRTRPKSCPMRP
jgi:hypothetical protein